MPPNMDDFCLMHSWFKLKGDFVFVSFQSEIHFSKLAIDKTGDEMVGLNTRLDEINLFTDKSDKLLKKARAEKQV